MSYFLVIGGAGFIGSHMLKELYQAGHQAVTIDDLSTGHRDSVRYGEFIHGSIADKRLIDDVLKAEKFDGVFHFASRIEVSRSFSEPKDFYSNNVANTLSLVHSMMDQGCKNLVFSSTAAVYGIPNTVPINERCPISPLSPYGWSKAFCERILIDYGRAYGLVSTSLRYFNAAGCDPFFELGERHEPETHLIPLLVNAALRGEKQFRIFGGDYDTLDGTCVRDYVHVNDLCAAHSLAMSKMINERRGGIYNLGTNRGFSVIEVLRTVEKVIGFEFDISICKRREGDPPCLVADARLAKLALGWRPRKSSLESLVTDVVTFQKKYMRVGFE